MFHVKPTPERSSDLLLAPLRNFKYVFADDKHDDLAEVKEAFHGMDLKEDQEPPHRPMYNLSAKGLEVLRQYVESAQKWVDKTTKKHCQHTSPIRTKS